MLPENSWVAKIGERAMPIWDRRAPVALGWGEPTAFALFPLDGRRDARKAVVWGKFLPRALALDCVVSTLTEEVSHMIRKILIPVDFSEPSSHACRYGISLAARLAASAGGDAATVPSVEIFHCYEIPAMTGPDGSLLVGPEVATDIMDDALARLDAFAASQSTAVELGHKLTQGPPAESILARAEEIGADLIVMGTQGKRGIKRFFLGSVAEQVLRASAIPVLTIRPPGEAA